MADKPCIECNYYDPIMVRNNVPARHGRCAFKSVYPAAEEAGQTFPPGVKRAEPGELAKPVIVVGKTVEKTCQDFRIKGRR